MKYLEGLNEAQSNAVLHTEGPLLIIAGAGTGKTKTVIHRIAHLIYNGVPGNNILAITFTNKAAGELRERAIAMLADYQTQPVATTFHAFGVSVLREFGHHLGISKRFHIADDDATIKIIKEGIKQLGYDTDIMEPRKVRSLLSRWKNEGKTREDVLAVIDNPIADVGYHVWEHYIKTMEKENMVDFDDLLLLPLRLFQNHPDVLQELHKRFTYIHVDEYQDTNSIQCDLVKLLAKGSGNICAVGDADQTIYTWRGAQVKNILNFEKDFPNAHVVFLEDNYRSTENILTGAQAVIEKNVFRIPKTLRAQKGSGSLLHVYGGIDERDEAFHITHTIQNLLQEGSTPDSIAVLFRTHYVSRVLEEAFLRAEIPYTVVGTRFFDRKEIKDILSYVRIVAESNASADLVRALSTPKRGIGKTSLLKIIAEKSHELTGKARASYQSFQDLIITARHHVTIQPLSQVIKYLLSASGIEDMLLGEGDDGQERLDNLKDLVSLASRFDTENTEESLHSFLDHVSLMSDQDTLGQEKNKSGVRLMTVHASKGLEFDHVFIIALEEGLFPSVRNDGTGDNEEERRLMYVAMTRAKKTLSLSFAHSRMIFGSTETRLPSQFLSDIPAEILVADDTLRYTHGGEEKTIYLS